MMNTLILFALFISTLKADVCISGEGNAYTNFFGHYLELGQDSNGYMQYKERTMCGSEPNYLYNVDNQWGTSNSLGSPSLHIACENASASITSPLDCPQWSIDSVSVTNNDCREVILPCNSIEISGASASWNGVYKKFEGEDNLYKKKGDYYFLSYSTIRRAFYGTEDWDILCHSASTYDLEIAQASLSSLSDGDELTLNATFPSNREITIKCTGVDLCSIPLNQCSLSWDGMNSNYAFCDGTWLTQQVYHTTTDCSLPSNPPPGTGDGMTSYIEENIQCCPEIVETPAPTTASPTTASPTTASPTTASPTTASPTTVSPSNCSITLDQCLLSEDGANSNYAYCDGTSLIQQTYWTTTDCTSPSNPPPNTGEDGITSSWTSHHRCCRDIVETPAPTTPSPTTSDLCPVPLNQCYIMHGGTDSNYAYCNGTWLTQQFYHTTTDCSLPAIPPPGTGDGMISFIQEDLDCCPGTTTSSPITSNSCPVTLDQCSVSSDGHDSNYAYCNGTSLIQETYHTTTDCTPPSNPPPGTGEGVTSSLQVHHPCCPDIAETPTPTTPSPTTTTTTSNSCSVILDQCELSQGGTDSNFAYCDGTFLIQQTYHTTTDCSLPAIPPPGTGNGMTSSIAENLECCPGIAETPSPTTASPTTASPTSVSPTTSNSCPVTVDQCSPSHNGTNSNYAYCIGPWLIQQTYWTTTNCTLPSNPPPNTGDGMTSSIAEDPQCCPTPTTSNCSITLDQCLLSEDGANSNYAYCQGTDLIQETYWTTTNCTLPSNPPPNTGDGVTSSIAANPECCPEDVYDEEQ